MKRASQCLGLAAVLVLLMARGALAEAGTSPPAGPMLTGDPALAGLIREALDKRPELAQANATVQANLARVPQVKALPDPVFSLGIQNDGFKRIEIGRMETRW